MTAEREAPVRRDLLDIYGAAIDAVSGRSAVLRHLRAEPAGGRPRQPAAVAIGKAGAAMLRGLVESLGGRLAAGLLITRQGYVSAADWQGLPVRVIEGAHPVPDERSLAAGSALLDFIARQPAERPIWFLISGGASALVEVLRPGVSLADLRTANRWLLGSGLDIGRTNRLRTRLSEIKGGGLLRYLGERPSRLLLISDVPGDAPAAIGSGMLVPPDPADARLDLPRDLPACLRVAPPSASGGEPPGRGPVPEIVANLDAALEAARDRAAALGYPVVRHPDFIAGDAGSAGRRLAGELLAQGRGVHLWGGETTVSLPPDPGRGGRSQHLALAAAVRLAGRRDCWLLAAGTDGSDGSTDDAGALVDGGTLVRGISEGADPRHCLRRADAGRFLELSGDLIHTGPTGTNVMDLVVGLRLDDEPR